MFLKGGVMKKSGSVPSMPVLIFSGYKIFFISYFKGQSLHLFFNENNVAF